MLSKWRSAMVQPGNETCAWIEAHESLYRFKSTLHVPEVQHVLELFDESMLPLVMRTYRRFVRWMLRLYVYPQCASKNIQNIKKGYQEKEHVKSSITCIRCLLRRKPLGKVCGAALWHGFQYAALSGTGWGAGRWLRFTLPFDFLSDALICTLGLQWHLPFSRLFLKVFLIVANQTTVAANTRGTTLGHKCAAWCKLLIELEPEGNNCQLPVPNKTLY